MRTFTFNGVNSKDYFLTNDIRRPFLPPINVPSVKVPNRAGAIPLKKNEIEPIDIEIDVTIMAFNSADLRDRVRTIASFLIYLEDKQLIFSDEPNLYYNARFNQTSTDLEEIVAMGQGTLKFTCFDPFAYRLTESMLRMTGQEMIYHNSGTVPVFPQLRIVSTIANTFIKIINVTTGKFLLYNEVWDPWDFLYFDNQQNRVYEQINNEPATNYIKNLSLESEFFPLEVGDNLIRVENQNIDGAGVAGQLIVYWRERFY